MKISAIILFFTLFSLSTCVREIDLDGGDGDYGTIVVDGSFTGAGHDQVRLSRPNKFAFSVFERIDDAKVWVVDELGNRAQYLKQYSPIDGKYYYDLPPNAMPVAMGRLYHVEIELANGRKYTSTPQAMPAKIVADSILVEGRTVNLVGGANVVTEEERAFVSVQTTVPQGLGDVYLRWETNAVYYFPELSLPVALPPPTKKCFVTDNFNDQQFPLIVAQGGQSVQKEIGSKLVDQAFATSIYFNVVQRSISPAAYRFWQQFAQIANPQGTIFDAPAAAVRGNIFNPSKADEVPLGFFEVAAVDTLRRKMFNGDLGDTYYVLPPCDPNDYKTGAECFDCLLLKNSTTEIPYYWEF